MTAAALCILSGCGTPEKKAKKAAEPGSGPDPAKLEAPGDEYAERSYPKLDKINSAKVVDYTPKP